MRLSKNKDDKNSSTHEELEKKVDAMMDLHQPDAVPEKVNEPIKSVEPVDAVPPEIDIFAGTKTAPEVPGDLKKGLALSTHEKVIPLPSEGVSEAATEPEKTEEAELVTESTMKEKDPLDDPGIDKTVDEITREESDKVLAAEDAATATKAIGATKPSLKERVKSFFSGWWANKWTRWGTILTIIMLLVGSVAWPTSRYFILNSVGVRSSASIKIIDQSSGLPLKNVTVNLGLLKTKTNGDGLAAFHQIKLGSQELTIERVAFAPVHKQITIGWGSNPLPNVSLQAVGAQYVFRLTDYLSGKPIGEAEVVNGEASAFADKNGKVVLTLSNPENDTIKAKVTSKGYRSEVLNFNATTKTVFTVRMVPAQPVVYVSKQSGKYDVYKVDVDGKNKQLLLAGTGSERRDGMSVSVSPDGALAALVSSRGNKRDANKYLLDTLTLIDTKSGQSKVVDDAARIQLIDWSGNHLVYVATYAAPSAAYAQRQRLASYNTEENAQSLVAASDYFNGIASIDSSIYYVVAPSDPKIQPGFYKARIDGGGKQTILANKQIGTLVRTNATDLALETPDGWYIYTVGNNAAKKGNPPADLYANHQYVLAPGGNQSVSVDNRDGKGVLLLHKQKSEDKVIVTVSGLTMPLHWMNKNTILYRVQNNNETADYVVNIDGGEPKKISDVTATTGLLINY